jgi:glucose-1-phosphate cytidylyltransferase
VKVVIFCGGRGMRLESGNPSDGLPKPMASIGGRPLLWHIMSYYAHFGHPRFVLLLGFRGAAIRDYFSKPEFRRNGWEIEFLETGLDASIGERFAAAREAIDEDVFLTSYGDTLTDADLPTLIRNREESGKLGSLLAVPPNYTFNVVTSDENDAVTGFHDVAESELWVNGGFFVFDRRVFDYVQEGDDMPEILGHLIGDRQLLAIKYDGFWSPMDTLKDRERLEGLVRDGRSVWQVWAPARAC